MSPVIQIEGLNKTYRMGEVEVQALRNISLRIERGEFLAIMGASGSGKSTLMNIIGCLDRPTSGRYLLEGIDVASLKEEELAAIRSSRIGFVFQTFNLLSRTTAIENVELPLFYSERNLDGEKRAGELLEMLGLKGRENNNPNQLSGGQQQRVAIARSLINRPAILLADEPTGNLDSKNSAEIMEIISRLNREQGITVLVVTHDADVAAYTDRVVTFRDGAILSDVRNRAGDRAPAKTETLPPMRGSLEQAANGNSLNRTRKFGTMALSAAARALRRNKARAALTMLGIFIGVAAVIAMVAVGDGARYSVQQQIQSLGTNLLVVLPGATTANGVRAGAGSISTLTVADAEAIQKEVLAAAAVSYADHQVAQVVYAHQNWSTSIAGTTPIYLTIRDWPVVDGSISLLVGGIGIMNIMLVSVTERTREIGIRMAVGARRMQILLQFLVESALLSIVGGLAGVALGIVASKILSALASWPTLISPVAVFGGFAFAAAVGLFFGWYPARKASRLDPIEALRYE